MKIIFVRLTTAQGQVFYVRVDSIMLIQARSANETLISLTGPGDAMVPVRGSLEMVMKAISDAIDEGQS